MAFFRTTAVANMAFTVKDAIEGYEGPNLEALVSMNAHRSLGCDMVILHEDTLGSLGIEVTIKKYDPEMLTSNGRFRRFIKSD